MRLAAGAFALAVLMLGRQAVAQSSANTTGAQALFDEAKSLMKAGHYDQACPKLEESQRLDPGGGTLVALGLCYEQAGKLGSAWTTWDLALSDARSAHRADREALAQKHVQDLDKRVPRLRVVVAANVDGLAVTRDGAAMPSALWGTPVPIDPGAHAFEAHAPGKQAWTTTVQVPPQPVVLDVTVPALGDAPAAPAPVPAPAPAAPSTTPAPSPAPTPAQATTPAPAPPAPHDAAEPSKPMRTWAYVVGGAGVVSLAVGAAFAASASSKWSDAHSACPQVQCGRQDVVNEANDAGKAADVATVLFAAGGILAATGLALWFWPSGGDADPREPAAARVHVTPILGAVNGFAVGGNL
jgi:hypothetical protein